jgi:hypothetical protein
MLQKKRRNESDRELVARLFGMKKAVQRKAYAYNICRAKVESVDDIVGRCEEDVGRFVVGDVDLFSIR